MSVFFGERNKILEYIERSRNEIISFFKQLVSIPSVTGEEKEIQLFISKRLEMMGLSVDVWEPDIEELKKHPAFIPVVGDYKDRPNVVGVKKGVGGGRSLLFNGHVDVIPPGPLEAWKGMRVKEMEGKLSRTSI